MNAQQIASLHAVARKARRDSMHLRGQAAQDAANLACEIEGALDDLERDGIDIPAEFAALV